MLSSRLLGVMLMLLGTTAAASGLPFPQPLPQVYTAGQPSEEQLTQAAAAGVRTVIDLRQADEARGFDEAAAVAGHGLRYVQVPVSGAEGLTVANARALQQALEAARADGPVLLHCASGNRVGALLALIHAKLDGGDTEAAIALGRQAGLTKLEPATRAALQADAD